MHVRLTGEVRVRLRSPGDPGQRAIAPSQEMLFVAARPISPEWQGLWNSAALREGGFLSNYTIPADDCIIVGLPPDAAIGRDIHAVLDLIEKTNLEYARQLDELERAASVAREIVEHRRSALRVLDGPEDADDAIDLSDDAMDVQTRRAHLPAS